VDVFLTSIIPVSGFIILTQVHAMERLEISNIITQTASLKEQILWKWTIL